MTQTERRLERPMLSPLGGGYLVEWASDGMRCEISQITAKHGDFTVWLQWYEDAGGGNWLKMMGAGRLNLAAARSRQQEGARLAALHGNGWQWGDAIEQLSDDVMTEHREGDPPKRVSKLARPPGGQLGYLVAPLIPRLQNTVIHADPGEGKSSLAQALSACVATGTPFAGMPVQTGPVLYLDWETNEESFAYRMDAEYEGLGIAPELREVIPIDYKRMTGGLAENLGIIHRWVTLGRHALVVIDSLAWATQDDPNEAMNAIKVMDAGRTLGTTLLTLAHQTKATRNAGRSQVPTIFGSVFYEAAARSVWAMRGRPSGPSTKGIQLAHRKANDSPLMKELIALRVDWEPDSIRWTRVTEPKGSNAPGLAERVERCLMELHDWATVADVAVIINAKDRSTSQALEKLVERQLAIKRGGGEGGSAPEYRLASEPLGLNREPAAVPAGPPDLEEEVGGEPYDEPGPDADFGSACEVCKAKPGERFTPHGMHVCANCALAYEE